MDVSYILTNFNLQGPAALLRHSSNVGHRVSQVRGERPVDVRLQLMKETNRLSGSDETSLEIWKTLRAT